MLVRILEIGVQGISQRSANHKSKSGSCVSTSEHAPKQHQNASPEGYKYYISIQNYIIPGKVVCMALGSCILRPFPSIV